MASLNDAVREYTAQLSKGHIQRAYRGIMAFMSGLKAYLEGNYPDHTASALSAGNMDGTYFAFTPPALRDLQLKIAIVFLHEECRFELWLAGRNRRIQAEYIALLRRKDIGGYTLSQIGPGVDSIIATVIVEQPDFDDTDGLRSLIEARTLVFENDIASLLASPSLN